MDIAPKHLSLRNKHRATYFQLEQCVTAISERKSCSPLGFCIRLLNEVMLIIKIFDLVACHTS